VDFAGGGGADGVEIEEVERVGCGVVGEGGVLGGGGYALGGGEGVAGWDDGEDYVGRVGEGEVRWVEGYGGGEGALVGCFAGGEGSLVEFLRLEVELTSLGARTDLRSDTLVMTR
jgi:hypothetical protein